MRPSLTDLKKRFADQQTKKSTVDAKRDSYDFWNLDIGGESTVRILMDKDEDNENLFYVPKYEHKIENDRLSCLENYGEDCPICALSQQFYNAEGKGSVNGKKYWHSRTDIVRAYVVQDGVKHKQELTIPYQGNVTTLYLGKQVLERIIGSLADFKDDENPFQMINGCDFVIRKSKNGEQNSYVGSGFARRMSDIKVDAPLVSLKGLIPKRPNDDEVAAFLKKHGVQS